MTRTLATFTISLVLLAAGAGAEEPWKVWPPTEYLVESLAAPVQDELDAFHEDTGRFGTEPWICSDQNRIYPLAVAWATEHPANPWYHDGRVLHAIARGGEALADAMDENGMWTFRKKDNSTWGQIHMPWTYSRWMRAYVLVKDALPAESRAKWEKGLRLGFSGIRKYMDGGTHNIPTHHAMALAIAGQAFDNADWRDTAKGFMARVVAEQNPVGFWSEHSGPVVGYNRVYIDALGVYYARTKDETVLEALRRAAQFHASVLWPDGTAVSAIDERQIYHDQIDVGNAGFSWTPEGRGFLLGQVWRFSKDGAKLVDSDYAATMLLDGHSGEGIPLPSARATGVSWLSDKNALIQRHQPWQWALSGYTCEPSDSRWIQDRQNMVDVYHDQLGLIIGGGNTKLQPYWSTFTVGDPAALQHTPGDESPDFVPSIALRWTATRAAIKEAEGGATLTLDYGEHACGVDVLPAADGGVLLRYSAPVGVQAEGHVPFLRRGNAIETAKGERIALGEESWMRSAEEIGGEFLFQGLRVIVPPRASLRWPAHQHNPYKKDGSAPLEAAKLVVVLPFDEVGTCEVRLQAEQTK
ncbi:MAG: hypothetical protein IT364_03725 [Candidatus Hydrogenedentes bacterium]|nr:hypothetical protein [Candidatus Hydrogenedentota bacterium]